MKQAITVISSIRQSSARDAARKHVRLIGDGVRRNETSIRLHHPTVDHPRRIREVTQTVKHSL